MNMLTLMKRKKETIFRSRKSLLYHNEKPWNKIYGSKEFDGAKVGEIVG